jgi:hypothetical protein
VSDALETVTRAPRPPREGALALRVVAGPDAGAVVVVDHRCVVGSSDTCDLRLTDRMVSRRHVAVEPTARGLSVTISTAVTGRW